MAHNAVCRSMVLLCYELLRHAWACLPAVTPSRQAKLDKIKPAMEELYDQVRDS